MRSEADMAAPVMNWLQSRGLTPYGEVRWYSQTIDVVGLTDDTIEAVEMKLSLTKHVLYQAHLNQLASHRSWCAVATRPRKYAERMPTGVGLLVVTADGVEVLVEAEERRDKASPRYIHQIRGRCEYKTPFGEAGLPTMRGIGPAQEVYDRMEKYKAENPTAKWVDIYRDVPNHYAHARSMQGAMSVVEGSRARRLAANSGGPGQ